MIYQRHGVSLRDPVPGNPSYGTDKIAGNGAEPVFGAPDRRDQIDRNAPDFSAGRFGDRGCVVQPEQAQVLAFGLRGEQDRSMTEGIQRNPAVCIFGVHGSG